MQHNAFAQFYVNLNGAWTLLASNAVSVSGIVALRFDVIGTSLRLFVNGTLSTFAFDSSLTSGQVGIRSSLNASLDDYHVEQGTS